MKAAVVTFVSLGEGWKAPPADIVPVIEVLAQKKVLERVICHRVKKFFFSHVYAAIPFSVWLCIRLVETVFSFRLSRFRVEKLFDFFAQWRIGTADIVLFHGGFFLPRTLTAVQRRGGIAVDVTRTAHIQTNARIEQEEYPHLPLPLESGPFTRLAKTYTHSNDFDYVIAISDFVRQSYIENGFPEDRIFVASLDVDMTRFTPVSKDINSMFTAVYVADTTPLKGLQYLIDAWKSAALENAQLIIVGGWNVPDSLRETYTAQIQKDASIKVVEHTASPEQYYADASVFVLPSLTEGCSRVILEAMACGVPVITTENAQGIVEDGKTGFVVPVRDVNTMAEKIRYLHDHQNIATSMGKEARKAVENKQRFGEAVYEVCEQILRREGKRDTLQA